MALSKSTLQKGQIPIQCQLCEINQNIKWKCLQCDLLMCNTCREKIHPKIKTAGEHKIIDIKDIGLHQEESGKTLDFNSIKCQKHDQKNCCLFCKICDVLICSECVTSSHTKHEMVQIQEEYERKKKDLIQQGKQVKQEKQGLEKKHEKLNQIMKSENHHHDKTKEEILEQKKALQKAVDQHITELINELGQRRASVQTSITQEQTKIHKATSEMEVKVKKVENIINSTDVSKFFKQFSFLSRSMKVDTPTQDLNHGRVPKFNPGQITRANVGSLVGPPDTEINPGEITVKKLNEFNTNLTAVARIYSSPDNSLWICYSEEIKLENVRVDGINLKTISSYNVKVYDIAITTEGDVLLSTCQSKLQQLNIETGKLRETKYSVYPLKTTAIHITTDKKIIVGAGNNERIVGAGNNERKVIIVMDMTGRHEMTYEHDKENKPLFTFPRTMTSGKNGYIWVVDVELGKSRGRVVVLSKNGGVLYYNGHSDINTKDKPFDPYDIVTTSVENAVVTDCTNNGLHILNQSVRLIKYINLTDMGIELPLSLLYQHPRQLYIGCGMRKASKEMVNLQQIELSGC